MLSASRTAISMTLRPLIETLIRPVPVVPISAAGTPKASARDKRASTCSACHRDDDPRSRFGEQRGRRHPRVRRRDFRKIHCQPDTARAERALRERYRQPAFGTVVRRSNPILPARLRQETAEGPSPQQDRHREARRRQGAASPSDIHFLRAHDGSVPSSTIASPLALMVRPRTLRASSRRPTTPNTGVG